MGGWGKVVIVVIDVGRTWVGRLWGVRVTFVVIGCGLARLWSVRNDRGPALRSERNHFQAGGGLPVGGCRWWGLWFTGCCGWRNSGFHRSRWDARFLQTFASYSRFLGWGRNIVESRLAFHIGGRVGRTRRRRICEPRCRAPVACRYQVRWAERSLMGLALFVWWLRGQFSICNLPTVRCKS